MTENAEKKTYTAEEVNAILQQQLQQQSRAQALDTNVRNFFFRAINQGNLIGLNEGEIEAGKYAFKVYQEFLASLNRQTPQEQPTKPEQEQLDE